MDGMKRNLRYWMHKLVEILLSGLASMVIWNLAWIMEDPGSIPYRILQMCATTLPMFGPFLNALFGVNNDRNFSFTISMGSTRKDSFIGMEVMHHIMGILLLLIALCAYAVLAMEDKGDLSEMMTAGICCIFFTAFFGNLTTAIRIGLQGTAGTWMCIFVTLIGMIGMFFAMLQEMDIVTCILMNGWVITAGILLDVLTMVLLYRVVKKVEVRL